MINLTYSFGVGLIYAVGIAILLLDGIVLPSIISSNTTPIALIVVGVGAILFLTFVGMWVLLDVFMIRLKNKGGNNERN